MANDIEDISVEIAMRVGKDHDIPFRRSLQNSIIAYRATIYRQEYTRNGRFPAGSEESITLPMKSVPPAECLQEATDCVVFRTEQKVPRAIRRDRTAVPFAFVGSMNQEVSFMYLRPEEVISLREGTRFIKDKPVYMVVNDYIYTVNHDAGRITIRDVFGDPRELLLLQGCDKKPCKTNIDIDEDMKRTIKMMIFEELRQFNRLPEDQTIRLNENA